MAGLQLFTGVEAEESPDSLSSQSKSSDSTNGDTRHDLELGLGLTFVAGAGRRPPAPTAWGHGCRILTAEDFPSLGSRGSPRNSSTSSVSSSLPASTPAPAGDSCGEGRNVGGEVEGSSPCSQSHMVVGWPPVGSFRMNNLFNQSKDVNSSETVVLGKKASHDNAKEKTSTYPESRGRSAKSSLLVKVNMDGDLIGRKVDLNVHNSYESLASILDLMFHKPTNGAKASKLFDGSSEFALTYEDKDGDWMLLGDVPWEMFLGTVKRLRIMRTSDANVLAPRFESFRKASGC